MLTSVDLRSNIDRVYNQGTTGSCGPHAVVNALAIRDGTWPLAGHCERAYINECDRSQLPPEYRGKNHV